MPSPINLWSLFWVCTWTRRMHTHTHIHIYIDSKYREKGCIVQYDGGFLVGRKCMFRVVLGTWWQWFWTCDGLSHCALFTAFHIAHIIFVVTYSHLMSSYTYGNFELKPEITIVNWVTFHCLGRVWNACRGVCHMMLREYIHSEC